MNTKRATVLVMSAVIILTAGLFLSFYTTLDPGSPPPIVLPEEPVPGAEEPGPEHSASPDGLSFVTAEVSASNVQDVLATLSRPSDYECEIVTRVYYTGGSGQSHMRAWVSGTVARVDTLGAAEEPLEHSICTPGRLYKWSPGSVALYYEGASGGATADATMRLPTYEGLRALPARLITGGACIMLEGRVYIYAEAREGNYESRYWVEIETGLLSRFILSQNGETVYEAEVFLINSTPPDRSVFDLPGGANVLDIMQG